MGLQYNFSSSTLSTTVFCFFLTVHSTKVFAKVVGRIKVKILLNSEENFCAVHHPTIAIVIKF